jgi:hypothetical protein
MPLLQLPLLDNEHTPQRLTKAQPQAFTKGGQTIKAAEDEKLASMPMAEKLRQLAKLMISGQRLGWNKDQAAEEDEIRQRWMRLRAVLRA